MHSNYERISKMLFKNSFAFVTPQHVNFPKSFKWTTDNFKDVETQLSVGTWYETLLESTIALFSEFIDLNVQYLEKAWQIPFPREWSFCSDWIVGNAVAQRAFLWPCRNLFLYSILWICLTDFYFIIRAYPVSDDGDVICVALLFSNGFQHVWITRKWRVWKAQLPIREEMHSGWIVELSS